MKVYESYTKSTEASSLFLCWKKQKEKECPQFHYWSTTLNFQLTILMFVRSIRSWDFGLSISSVQELALMLVGCRNICVIWCFHKRHNRILQHTFTKASFFVSKTKRVFSSTGINPAHEQNSKCVKGDRGKNFYFHHCVDLVTHNNCFWDS